ncbi:MAG: sigma-54-dependent Fis family transcriptional regulator, partial [Deltaproteobacteria bacterium]|nr:sigma-54-dependent Fis family transcriptional regulator [Deltaproteobacteria bacterium]
FEIEELIAVIEKLTRTQEVRKRHNALLEDVCGTNAATRFLGNSPAFCELLNTASRLRGHNANILIEGESGTGKELLAKYIHSLERDIHRPFVAVNCAGIPDTLMESELFGYEKGAFTGAVCRKIGKFEFANNGDIFLDEISTLKPELQAKLLRVLQEREVTRLGGNSVIRINFRVIAATNQNLEKMVEAGLFRADLYHRLAVVHLNVPPLRERIDDIPFLAKHFLDKYKRGDKAKEITSKALSALKDYIWPGNVRELENLMHSLTVMVPEQIIDEDDLAELRSKNPYRYKTKMEEDGRISNLALDEYVDTLARDYIKRVLRISKGNKTAAAEKLKVSRSTFYNRCKELGIPLERE